MLYLSKNIILFNGEKVQTTHNPVFSRHRPLNPSPNNTNPKPIFPFPARHGGRCLLPQSRRASPPALLSLSPSLFSASNRPPSHRIPRRLHRTRALRWCALFIGGDSTTLWLRWFLGIRWINRRSFPVLRRSWEEHRPVFAEGFWDLAPGPRRGRGWWFGRGVPICPCNVLGCCCASCFHPAECHWVRYSFMCQF